MAAIKPFNPFISVWSLQTIPRQEQKDRVAASSFLKALHKACPVKITRLLTDKGKAFVETMIAWDAKSTGTLMVYLEHMKVQPKNRYSPFFEVR